MGTTPLAGLPFPEPSAQPYVHLDMQALAEATDDVLPLVCTSGSRPEHRPGRRIFETNTGRAWISDGSRWLPMSPFPANPRQFLFAQLSAAGTNAGGDGTFDLAPPLGITLDGKPNGVWFQDALPNMAPGSISFRWNDAASTATGIAFRAYQGDGSPLPSYNVRALLLVLATVA